MQMEVGEALRGGVRGGAPVGMNPIAADRRADLSSQRSHLLQGQGQGSFGCLQKLLDAALMVLLEPPQTLLGLELLETVLPLLGK